MSDAVNTGAAALEQSQSLDESAMMTAASSSSLSDAGDGRDSPSTVQDAIPPASGKRQELAVAVDPIALITTECVTVTSAMRKHARWAHSSVSAILGGSGSSASNTKLDELRPGSPRTSLASRRAPVSREPGAKTSISDAAIANRWGLRGKKGKSMQDNPLLSAFARLRRELLECTDIRTFDTPALLHPFLQVIRSSSTSAPITSLALIAITKFFSYNIIQESSPRLPLAMQLLSSAITHCRFEASDSAADEIVLLRILKLMEIMISSTGGPLLGDESICEMMETGLSMCCQMRLSELLRRSAEMSMAIMCQTVFERLKGLDYEEEEAAVPEKSEDDLQIEPSVNGDTMVAPDAPAEAGADGSAAPESVPETPVIAVHSAEEEREPVEPAEIKPYSLPSIRELFRVLVELLDPHNRQHTDTMRVMALRIIDVALEVAGPAIADHPSLANLAKDDLCRYLFQLVRSDAMEVLHESLRVAGTLLATCRGVLKLQQELFLSYLVACLHPKVEIPREPGIDASLYEGVPQAPKLAKPAASQPGSGRNTPVPVRDRQNLGLEGGFRKPEAREAMVESIGALARIPSFMVELFVNYDSELDRADLCEDMVGLLSRNAFPDSATWSTTNVPPLCLDALLGFIEFIYSRLDDSPATEGYPDAKQLRDQRAIKKHIIKGTSKFNDSPKSGIAYLAQQGVIANVDDPICIAKFLKGTTRISKQTLGEYLSHRANEALLGAFLDLFDFSNKRVDEALRELLETFRLPGESALIERIVNSFSEKYCTQAEQDDVADKDSAFVLIYAIIMLNVDQHSPKVKAQNRMVYTDFAKNLRGVNSGKDFAPEYLQSIFDAIKTKEIVLPDEHDNKLAFDYAWKELLLKTESAGALVLSNTNIYDADMFAATWQPIIATLSFVFMSATDETVFSRVSEGFEQCARIAARYGITDALDRMVYCLGTMSTLLPPPPNTALNAEVQVEETKVMVSEVAVRFGRDPKAQLATMLLFQSIAGHERLVGAGWQQIVKIWLNLFLNSLIPPFFSPETSTIKLPPIPLRRPSQVIDKGQANKDVGLFSTLSSYLSSYAADEPPEPSDEEIESTVITVQTINSCFLGDIFANLMELPANETKPLVAALLAQLPEDSSPVVVVKPEPRVPGQAEKLEGPVYDPTYAYVLELATILASRDEASTEEFGKEVAGALQAVIRDSANTHPVILGRTISYLFNMLQAAHSFPWLRVPVILHAVANLGTILLPKVAVQTAKGIAECVAAPGPLRNEMINTPDFWSVLRSTAQEPEAAPIVFQILEDLASNSTQSVTADNYEMLITLLDNFASAGSIGAVQEQKQDQLAKRGKVVKQKRQHAEIISRSVKAVNIVYGLTGRVPTLIKQSQLEKSEAWAAYWSPIFKALRHQCINPCREIRHQAFSSLQRSLLSPDLTSQDHLEWTAIFDEVLFPLIIILLKPETYQSDPVGMSETRVQAATLLCKIFLHYLVLLSEWDGMLGLWLKILDIMDRLMNSGQGDHLEEAVPESLKNIILVMSNGGYLVPPRENPANEKLWTQTWTRMGRFLPNLFAELFPEEAAAAKGQPRKDEGAAAAPPPTAAATAAK